MERLFSIAERVLLTLWVGGMWIVGYLVAPSLFVSLADRQLAGQLAGNIFSLMAWLGLACGAGLLLITLIRAGGNWLKAWRVWALVVMLVLVAVGLFVLQPYMQELKAQGLLAGSVQAAEFGRLHGVSSILYLINSLLGLALVVAGLRGQR